MFRQANVIRNLGTSMVLTDMGIFPAALKNSDGIFIVEMNVSQIGGVNFFVPTENNPDIGGVRTEITLNTDIPVALGLTDSASAVGDNVDNIVIATQKSGNTTTPVMNAPSVLSFLGAVYERNKDGSVKRDVATGAPLVAKTANGVPMIGPILFSFVENYSKIYSGGASGEVPEGDRVPVGDEIAGQMSGAFVAAGGGGGSCFSAVTAWGVLFE